MNIKNLDSFRNILKKKYVTKLSLSPVEQLLYIIPFNKNKLKLFDSVFYTYKNKDIIKKTILKIYNKNLYPDIKNIALNIYNSDKNNLIDCSGVNFMSKCILNVVHNSNKTNIDKFIIDVRKYLPLNKQKIFHIGGFYRKYKKYKSNYYYTGKEYFKYKYDKYSRLYKDIIL